MIPPPTSATPARISGQLAPPVEPPAGTRAVRVGVSVPGVSLALAVAEAVETVVAVGVDTLRVCPESGLTWREDVFTTSKSEPGIAPSACRSSLLQRSSGAPERNQLLPLSATIMP